MMNTLLALVSKELRVFWNDRTAVVLSFLVPMVLITIFGMIFGGGGGGPSGIRVLVVDEANSETSEKLIEILRSEDTFRIFTDRSLPEGESVPLEREYAASLLQTDASTYRYLLILPEDLLSEDFGFNLELLYNPQNTIENNIVQGILQKTLFSQGFPLLLNNIEYGITDSVQDAFNGDLAMIISEHFGADPDEILEEINSGGFFGGAFSADSSAEGEETDASDDLLGGVFNMEKTQVFGKGKNPASQSVGGWAVMFLLFSLTGAASSLFEERDQGLFLRILAGPANRTQILWSKFIFCALLGLSQMVVLILFGEVVFDVITSWRQLLPLFVVSLAAASAATAFGMLLSSIAKTPAQANGLGTFLILGMSAFGGAMFPLFMIPETIRTYISPFTLVYWAMDGLLAVLWRDAGLVQVLPQVGVLFAIACVVLSIALWRFRRGDLFR
ncbi:ABC transporter permease [Puniceicoccales bacterium CK1056]|uniref:ABC transporter permease n=2 Tax=Oceanipulchritudo coccoides TaxID=2706888 RepID=A0A6B2M203_9BACT|nr:ABC transporter permease [Oceanipulchritudo coccoides]